MEIVRAILAALFILMSLGIAMQSWRVRRLGLLLGAVVYAAAGAWQQANCGNVYSTGRQRSPY
jgi:hypothetical protein